MTLGAASQRHLPVLYGSPFSVIIVLRMRDRRRSLFPSNLYMFKILGGRDIEWAGGEQGVFVGARRGLARR